MALSMFFWKSECSPMARVSWLQSFQNPTRGSIG